MRPRDTTPEAWKVYLGIIRKQTPAQRMEQVFRLTEAMRQLRLAALRQQYPNASEHEIFLRSVREKLGRAIFRKVYGDVLPDDGPARKVA